MLKQRLLTAAILVPLLILGILKLSTPYFALMIALIVAQGSWEWGGLMKLSSTLVRGLYVLVVSGCVAALWFLLDRSAFDWLALPVLGVFWWLLAMVWVLSYPRTVSRWSATWLRFLIGLAVLLPTWLALVGLHGQGQQGAYLVLYLLFLIAFADSGAYFGGRQWGKRKLAPAVSPGKTWEGVFSAFAASTLVALVAAWLFGLPGNLWPAFVVLSLVTVVFSILGDLTESMFKRQAGMKDSGTLLPGHGGVLDRIDSITAAAPVFVVGLWLADGFGLFGGV
jgi:phosphatidate cytidylyltransferase